MNEDLARIIVSVNDDDFANVRTIELSIMIFIFRMKIYMCDNKIKITECIISR